jgi:hypothetical protein
MSNIGASTLSSQEHPLEIRVLIQPSLGATVTTMGHDPLQRSPGVLVRGGKRVFGGFPVVHRDCNNFRFGHKSVQVIVVLGTEWRRDAEGASMEVDKQRELLIWFGELWEVKARGEIGLGDD